MLTFKTHWFSDVFGKLKFLIISCLDERVFLKYTHNLHYNRPYLKVVFLNIKKKPDSICNSELQLGKIKSFDIYFRFYLKLPTSLLVILIYFQQDNWVVGINFCRVRYKREKNNTNSYLYNDKLLRVFVLKNPRGQNPLVYVLRLKKPL